MCPPIPRICENGRTRRCAPTKQTTESDGGARRAVPLRVRLRSARVPLGATRLNRHPRPVQPQQLDRFLRVP